MFFNILITYKNNAQIRKMTKTKKKYVSFSIYLKFLFQFIN